MQHGPEVQVTVTKPGGIDAPNRQGMTDATMMSLFNTFGYVPRVHYQSSPLP
jgi:hypothetical protein